MRGNYFLVVLCCCLLAAEVCARDTFKLQPYKRDISLVGFTGPRSTQVLSSEIGGKLEQVFVDMGDVVPPDGRVAILDDTFIQLEIEQNSILQQQLERELLLEKKTLARYEKLITRNSTAQSTFDEAQLRADVLDIKLKSLENEKRTLQEKLIRHTLRGTPGWRVIDRFAESGEYLRQGEPLVSLGDFAQPLVSFLLSIEELNLLRDMKDVELELPEIKKGVPAQIHRISPDIDLKSRKVRVDIALRPVEAGAQNLLRGGLRAKLTIKGKIEPDQYIVPTSSLTSRYQASWLTASTGDTVQVIVVGRVNPSDTIVSGGSLSQDQQYLTEPLK